MSDVTTNTRRNRFGIPDDVSSAYLNHAEAYRNVIRGTDDTLEKFPTLIWDGVRYRPKSKPLKNKNYVYFERYIDRRTRRKLGQDRRSLRIWKQTSKDVKPGTFYFEKLKQLRDLNTYEDANGLTRTRLRDVDMDHKNALRSVEIYTEGLDDFNTQYIFDILEQYDLFTGDDARNLVLRNREIHRKLWPKMKAALKKLNHKTFKDFKNAKNPELEYLKYLAADKNPRTGSTPLREYIETIKFIEEQAADAELAKMTARIKALHNKPNLKPQVDPIRQKLADILGGEEALKAFVARLKKDYPYEIQTDLIRGEFEYIGSFGPLDEARLRRIIDE